MTRKIKEQEVVLLRFLLKEAGLSIDQHPLPEEVDEYEGGVMGSIGMGSPNAYYLEDIIQVAYVDNDGVEVIITLTKDTEHRLLDLDFWKMDFSRLIEYPLPEEVIIKFKA